MHENWQIVNQPKKEACMEFNKLCWDKKCFSAKKCYSHSPFIASPPINF